MKQMEYDYNEVHISKTTLWWKMSTLEAGLLVLVLFVPSGQ